jgi:hypothetical protein
MRIEVPVGGIGVAKVCYLDSLLYTVFFLGSLFPVTHRLRCNLTKAGAQGSSGIHAFCYRPGKHSIVCVKLFTRDRLPISFGVPGYGQ